MALMAARGLITPMPSACVFADTGHEPGQVYDWLEWLALQLPFPTHVVSAGDLAADALKFRTTKDGRRYTRTVIPAFMKNADGSQGKLPMRICTIDYKLRPLLKKQRELGGIKRGQKTVGVISWIGISTDEATRMKDSREPWAQNRWPLIELGMSRKACLDWWRAEGLPTPPRSACVFCPFHSDQEWLRLKTDMPHEFAKAVRFDQDLRETKAQTDNMTSVPFLHREMVPLDRVDFAARLSKKDEQIDLFQNECLGMCGV